MRVAMVTPSFPDSPDAPVGGVEAVVSCLVRALLAQQPELDLHVIRCLDKRNGESYKEGEPAYTVHCVDNGGRLGCLFSAIGPKGRIAKLLDRLKPDVVHVQTADHYVDGRKYPAVLTVHGIPERDTLFREHSLPHLRAWVLSHRHKPSRMRYSNVIAIAGYVAQQLEDCMGKRGYFIPNPIEEEFFSLHRTESGPRVLFAGLIIPRKNVHGLIEAAGILARDGVEFTLRLAGSKPSVQYNRILNELIEKWDISKRVEFLGSLDRPALQKELQVARCMVLPSFQETAPVIISEACAVGVPSVVTPAGGSAEMVSHMYSGVLVDPRNPQSIADGIRPLLTDPELAEKYGQIARQWAKVYHPKNVAEQTLAVYETVMRDWKHA